MENSGLKFERGCVMRRVLCGVWISIFLVVAVAGNVVLGAVPVRAEEERPTTEVNVDILSQYIWRGYALSKDSAVIQPSVAVGYRGFNLNIWGNLDTDDQNPVGPSNQTNWNETDLTLSYTHNIYKGLSGTVGMVYYSLDQVDDLFEIFGGVSYELPWFTVGFTAYREVSHQPGWWLQFDLSRSFPIPWHGMSLDVGMTFGMWDIEDKAAEYSAWHSGLIYAGLNIPVGKYVTVTPKIGFAYPLSGEASDNIRAVSWDGKENHVYGGIGISASF
jgi:uncharacterized protein (TIGR02001 family)